MIVTPADLAECEVTYQTPDDVTEYGPAQYETAVDGMLVRLGLPYHLASGAVTRLWLLPCSEDPDSAVLSTVDVEAAIMRSKQIDDNREAWLRKMFTCCRW